MTGIFLAALLLSGGGGEAQVRGLLAKTTGVIELPPGVTEVSAELAIAAGSHNLEIRGAKEGSTLRGSASFRGAAILTSSRATGLRIVNVRIEQSPGDGIVLGEGTGKFEVTGCTIQKVAGGGIVVNGSGGRIAGNSVLGAGRAGFVLNGASDVRVENNNAEGIGFSKDEKGSEVPAGILTTGAPQRSVYAGNHLLEINGHCLSLGEFRDGEVRGNTCDNREEGDAYTRGGWGVFTAVAAAPGKTARRVLIDGNTFDGMKFGAISIGGSGYIVTRNRFYHVNTSHSAKDGIYLGAAGNVVEDNRINGYRMSERCVVNGPGVGAGSNRVGRNECSDDLGVNAWLGVKW